MVLEIPENERADFDDVLGSGGILRRVISSNTEGAQAEFGEEVTVRYSEWLLADGQQLSDEQERRFRIGDGEVMPALELIAKMMRVGEECEVRCEARFAYGEKGAPPRVPPQSSLRIVMSVVRVGRQITADMTSAQLLDEADKKKASGNRYFQEGNYEQAARLYKRALKILESWERSDKRNTKGENEEEEEQADGEEEEEDDEESKRCKALLVALGNNVANVQHKLKETVAARQSSLEVLQIDATNVKALYRLAQITLEGSEFDEATQFLKTALTVDPGNAKFRDMLGSIKGKKAAHRERERKLYAKLGGKKHGSVSESESGRQTRNQQELSPARQFVRDNISMISTVFTMAIAMVMYVFLGKRYNPTE